MRDYKIVMNCAKCLICGEIIESKHTHDYQTCSCGNLSVDGGTDYCKRNIKEGTDTYKEMSVIKDTEVEEDVQ